MDALLVLARADAWKLGLKHERFDLKDAVEEASAMVAARAQERNVALESACRPVEVDADHTRIVQLLTNLLANAVQYNREGGRVVVTTGREESKAVGTATHELTMCRHISVLLLAKAHEFT